MWYLLHERQKLLVLLQRVVRLAQAPAGGPSVVHTDDILQRARRRHVFVRPLQYVHGAAVLLVDDVLLVADGGQSAHVDVAGYFLEELESQESEEIKPKLIGKGVINYEELRMFVRFA
jgi:hypothetical protein